MTTDDLLQRWSDGSITAEELRELTAKLAAPEHQSALLDDWLLESSLPDRLPGASVAAIPEALRTSLLLKVSPTVEPQQTRKWTGWLSWRPLTAAAAGLVIGAFSATAVWGYAAARVARQPAKLVTLVKEGFEGQMGRLPSRIPTCAGIWSGDPAEITSAKGVAAKEGRQALRFIRADRDTDEPEGTANGCDVFRFVDLRQMKASLQRGEAVLELSASFFNARQKAGEPVYCSCEILTFQGSPEEIASQWPFAAMRSLTKGKNSLPLPDADSGGPAWFTLKARAPCPAEADFALIILCASRRAPHSATSPEFGMQFVDDVRLVLEAPRDVTQP